MRYFAIMAYLVLAIIGTAQASEFPKMGDSAVGATANYFIVGQSDNASEALDDFQNFGGVSLNSRYFIKDNVSLSLEAGYGRLDTKNLGANVDAYSIGGGFRTHYSDMFIFGVRPAVGLGLVSTYYDSDDLKESKTETAFYAEAVAEKLITDRWAAEIGARGRIEMEDTYSDIQLFVGFNYLFGQKKSAASITKKNDLTHTKIPEVNKTPVIKNKPIRENEPQVIVSVMVVPERSIRFKTGSAELTEDSNLEALKDYADAVRSSNENLNILVEGHTDSTGPAEYNQQLSEQRAMTIKQVFMQEFNVPRNKVEARGLGEQTPIATNETAEGRAQNRRVEIKIRKAQ